MDTATECSFNLAYVDLEQLNYNVNNNHHNQNLNNTSSQDANICLDETLPLHQNLNHTTNDQNFLSHYDESSSKTNQNKFNSFPMRVKKPQNGQSSQHKLKQTPKSSSSLHYNGQLLALSQDELSLTVRLARARTQESDRFKHILRNNYWPSKHPIRKYLWTCLLQQTGLNSNANKENNSNTSSSNESEYNKHLNQIFGKLREIDISLPDFVHKQTNTENNPLTSKSVSANNSPNHLNYYFLNSKGKQAIKRILCVYEYHYPQVTFNPGLVSISSLLLHYMQEHEVFAALCFMSSTKEHLIESKASWDTTCSVFTRLLKNYCRSSYEIISKYATDSLESIFNEWYWWIFDCLSFDYLVKIMDCYLYEGLKVLYRVSLAIVQQFSRYIELIEECEFINEYFFDVVKSENIKVDKNSIKQFCESSTNIESIDKLLKVSFSIRNLKRSTIREYYTKEETKRKNFGAHYEKNEQKTLSKIENNQQNSPTRIFLNEAMTSVLSHANTSTSENFVSTKSSASGGSFKFRILKKKNSKSNKSNQMHTNPPIKYNWSLCFADSSTIHKSFLFNSVNLCTIWNWIPQRLSVYTPNMLFTTQENGTSVNTLLNVLDELDYCLIVIKTFNNEIFGAFCAGDWNERKQKKLYFGTGETFLFSLAPDKKLYKWIGLKTETKANQEMFIRVDQNKIAIGGGGKDGLSINTNLLEGTTNRCDTFENEPLASVNSFQIAILEVVGFGTAKN